MEMWRTEERYGIYRTRIDYKDLYITLMYNKQYESKDLAEWDLEKIVVEELKERKKRVFKVKDWTVIMPSAISEKMFRRCLEFGCESAEWYEIKKIVKLESHVVNEELYKKALDYLEVIGKNRYIGVSALQKYLRAGYKDCDLILQRLVKERYVSEWSPIFGQIILRTK